jgi:hypothetical protein
MKAFAMEQLEQLRLKARRARRRLVIAIRKPFRLDEDQIRDEVLSGLFRDMPQLAEALSKTVQQLNDVTARLRFYEARVPNIKAARAEFERHQRRQARKEKESRERFEQLVKDGMPEEEARLKAWPPKVLPIGKAKKESKR